MSAPVKSRPILFSAPMVRALLDGRKLQTRRIVKHERVAEMAFATMGRQVDGGLYARLAHPGGGGVVVCCPYGAPGDTLWVKETWRPRIAHSCSLDTCDCGDVAVSYAAGGRDVDFPDGSIPPTWTMPKAAARGNVSPLLMPRWASRITLEVTGVRVERLQDISEEDARVEGVENDMLLGRYGWRNYGDTETVGDSCEYFVEARDSFRSLWESINGADSWAANPFVWCVSFKVVTP